MPCSKRIYGILIILLGGMALNSCSSVENDSVREKEDNPCELHFTIPFEEIDSLEYKSELLSSFSSDTLDATLEFRGGYSRRYPKKSMSLDLKSDDALCSLSEDDDWILNASYIDKTFMRHTLAYDLFREMDSNNVSPNYAFTRVFFNEETYGGLYILMEKMDRSTLKVSKKDSSAFIFKEPHLFRHSLEVATQDSNNFHHQTFPKIYKEDRSHFLSELRTSLLQEDSDQFQSDFQENYSVQNILDWHLLILLANAGDGVLKGFYLYRSCNTCKIRVAPWDYDHAFGRDGDGEMNVENWVDPSRSILFKRLMELSWYRQKLKERWNLHRNSGLISLAEINGRLDTHEERMAPLVLENFSKWPIENDYYFDDMSFHEEMEHMQSYFAVRIPSLDLYFRLLH